MPRLRFSLSLYLYLSSSLTRPSTLFHSTRRLSHIPLASFPRRDFLGLTLQAGESDDTAISCIRKRHCTHRLALPRADFCSHRANVDPLEDSRRRQRGLSARSIPFVPVTVRHSFCLVGVTFVPIFYTHFIASAEQ